MKSRIMLVLSVVILSVSLYLLQPVAADTPTVISGQLYLPLVQSVHTPAAPALDPAIQEELLTAGSATVYQFTVINIGDVPGRFGLEILAQSPVIGVSYSVSPSSVVVQPNQSRVVVVSVTTASQAQSGTDVRVLRAYSLDDTSKVAEAVIRTTVITPTPTAMPTVTPDPIVRPTPTATTDPRFDPTPTVEQNVTMP